ncbi:MAG: hypothetical protein H6581_12795 [Bacteroidia bacterium]|nr:hypothetical protein [Bacteroidia bacterium]
MTPKVKYLSYIEDTPKHHHLLQEIAEKAVQKAIRIAKENNISITYLLDGKIVRESPDGQIEVIGEVEEKPREVKIGEQFEL